MDGSLYPRVCITRERGKRERERKEGGERGREGGREMKTSAKISFLLSSHAFMFPCCNTKPAIIIAKI